MEADIGFLIEDGNVAAAGIEPAEIPMGTSDSPDKWKQQSGDPVIMRGGPASGKEFRTDFEWIEQNSRKYKGQWIAIRNGILLGNNQSRLSLQRELKDRNLLEGATFFKVEE
jgi:hypothetical protein